MVMRLVCGLQLFRAVAMTNQRKRGEVIMKSCIRIMVLCTVAGFLLATVFMTPGGAAAGAVKGLLVGALIAWGEWNSKRKEHKEAVVSYIRH
jgi:membrane associated rhomboid family serine protease